MIIKDTKINVSHSSFLSMKYYVLVPLFFTAVVSLQGTTRSICYDIKRITRYTNVSSDETTQIIDNVPTARCCDGYTDVNGICKPQCEPPCKYGFCNGPNECKCHKTHTGKLCDIHKCPAGHHGHHCGKECPSNTFGENCSKNCTCENGHCDPAKGFCHCHDGWSGNACSVKCPDGLKCRNGGVCNSVNSTCECPPGFVGQYCEKQCDDDYWGKNCSEKCYCGKYGCSSVDGQCNQPCVHGVLDDDICWCVYGWTGEFCSEQLCPIGTYGENCENPCSCQLTTTKNCNRITGACECKPGWSGDKCETPCSPMSFGENCRGTCQCTDGHHKGCNPETGTCYCEPGWTGKTCDRRCTCKNGYCNTWGNCVCDLGWQGDNCEKECEEGYFGEECNSICPMPKNLEHVFCHHIYGLICEAGFTGINCTESCPKGTYGIECRRCSCENDSNCNTVTGECDCNPGWQGLDCDKPCPEGFYGEKCKNRCKCKNCRPSDGYCPCQSGFNEARCKEYCPLEYYNLTTNHCINSSRNGAEYFINFKIIFITILMTFFNLMPYHVYVPFIKCSRIHNSRGKLHEHI